MPHRERGCHGTRHILFRAGGGGSGRDSGAGKVQMEERTKTRALPSEATGLPRGRQLVRLSARSPYSARRDFGKISSFQGIEASPDPAGHRSLTAAKAANDFTRNCVLGFSRNWYFQIGSVIRGCAECFYGTLRTLIRISYSGLPVPLLRYGERYALFMSSAMRWTQMSRCPTFEIRRRE